MGENIIDINGIYRTLMQTYADSSQETEAEVEVEAVDPLPGPSSSSAAPCVLTRNTPFWVHQVKVFLEQTIKNTTISPFLKPVDVKEYPDYYQIVKKPMDIMRIKANFDSKVYQTPQEVKDDFDLIISNSKLFNTNPQSMIYRLTRGIETVFNTKLDHIVESWKDTIGKAQTKKSNSKANARNDSTESSSESSLPSTSTSSSSSSNSSSNRVLNGHRSKLKTLPQKSYKVKTRVRESFDGTASHTNSDDSEYQPLSELKRQKTFKSDESDTSLSCVNSDSSSEDERVPAPPVVVRPRRAKRKRLSSSEDSEAPPTNGVSSSDDCLLSVSSRGRVRKLTPKVREFWHK